MVLSLTNVIYIYFKSIRLEYRGILQQQADFIHK